MISPQKFSVASTSAAMAKALHSAMELHCTAAAITQRMCGNFQGMGSHIISYQGFLLHGVALMKTL